MFLDLEARDCRFKAFDFSLLADAIWEHVFGGLWP